MSRRPIETLVAELCMSFKVHDWTLASAPTTSAPLICNSDKSILVSSYDGSVRMLVKSEYVTLNLSRGQQSRIKKAVDEVLLRVFREKVRGQ